MSNGQKQAGVALAIAAVVAAGFFLLNRDKESGVASCALSAGALAALTKTTHSGESASVIVAQVGLPLACNLFVQKLVEEPEQEVKAEVELPSGEVDVFEQPGEELIAPAPPPETAGGADVSHLIECVRWDNEVLFRLCSEGRLGPPL